MLPLENPFENQKAGFGAIYCAFISHYGDAEAAVKIWLLSTPSVYSRGIFLTGLSC